MICNSTFTHKSSLKNHIATVHEGKKPLKCDYKKCGLNRHILAIHEGKVLYKCQICNKNVLDKIDIKRHLKVVHDQKFDLVKQKVKSVHQKKQPSFCTICLKSYSDLQLHVKLVHEEAKPFLCSICKCGFTELYKLKSHIRTDHKKS